MATTSPDGRLVAIVTTPGTLGQIRCDWDFETNSVAASICDRRSGRVLWQDIVPQGIGTTEARSPVWSGDGRRVGFLVSQRGWTKRRFGWLCAVNGMGRVHGIWYNRESESLPDIVPTFVQTGKLPLNPVE